MSEQVYDVSPEWKKRAYIDDAKYAAMYERSIKDPTGFWAEEAKRIYGMMGHSERVDIAAEAQAALVRIVEVARCTGDRKRGKLICDLGVISVIVG